MSSDDGQIMTPYVRLEMSPDLEPVAVLESCHQLSIHTHTFSAFCDALSVLMTARDTQPTHLDCTIEL